MFKDLMHNLLGSLGQGAAVNPVLTGSISASAYQNSILHKEQTMRRSVSKKIFSGNIEVQQVSNGYVINIATREGYEYETHIAQTITEVNEIITSHTLRLRLSLWLFVLVTSLRTYCSVNR